MRLDPSLRVRVAAHLEPADLGSAARLCRAWGSTVLSERLWRVLCIRDGYAPASATTPPPPPCGADWSGPVGWRAAFIRGWQTLAFDGRWERAAGEKRDPQRMMKLQISGACHAGKTSFLMRFTEDHFTTRCVGAPPTSSLPFISAKRHVRRRLLLAPSLPSSAATCTPRSLSHGAPAFLLAR